MGEAAVATRTNNKRVEYHLCPATHWICFVSRIKSYLSLGYYYYASWVKSIDFSLVTCDETRALISCSALLFSALLCCRVYDISINQSFLKWLSHTSHTHTANNCVDAGKATLIMPIYRKCFVFVFRNVISIPKKTEAWHVHVIDITVQRWLCAKLSPIFDMIYQQFSGDYSPLLNQMLRGDCR